MNSAELWCRFTYHHPSEEQIPIFEEIRKQAADYAEYLNGVLVESREKSLAITNLEQVVFWANAAIARNVPKETKNDQT